MVPGEAFSQEAAKLGKPAASDDLTLGIAKQQPAVAQRLLPELLAEIFLRAAVEEEDFAPPDNSHHLHVHARRKEAARLPIRISHVCKAWRDAALDVRSLWSSSVNIHPRMMDAGGWVDRRCMALFDTYMRRSRGAPLTIFSAIPPSSSLSYPVCLSADTRPLNFADVLWALSKHQNRWLRVHIEYHGNCSYPKHPARKLKLVDLPLLEELNLVLPYPLAPTEDGITLDLSTCTRLQKLQLAGEVTIVSNGTLLHSLTEVDLTASNFMKLGSFPVLTDHSTFPTVLDVFKLLQLAPNLELLLARLAPSREGEELALETDASLHMVLPNLRRLVLQAEGDEEHLDRLCFFLDHIAVPNIYAFGLWCRLRRAPAAAVDLNNGAAPAADDNINNNFADWWLNLPGLLERSSFPPITSFYIDSDVISQREIRDCMHLLPYLHDLTLVHVPWSARGALRLALDPQKVNLAPELGVLRFIGVRFGGQKKLRMARVVKMVVSRWREHGDGEAETEGEGGRLKQVVFVGCDVAGLEEHPEIKKCEAEGLKVECHGCI